jgi:hypothetical protein
MGKKGIAISRTSTGFLIAALTVAFGCNQEAGSTPQSIGRSAEPPVSQPVDTPNPAPSPTPSSAPASTEILDPGCMDNPTYDTCLFYKNPVAQKKAPLNPSLSPTSNLQSLQIYGVKLANLNESGYLENSTYRITPGSGMNRVRKNAQGSWKYEFSTNCTGELCDADPDHKTGQLMGYYWLNRQAETMANETGKFYAKDKNITVETYYANMDNAYWDGESIILGDGGPSDAEYALGAEVYMHEAGHANLTFAATGTLGSSSQCSSVKGCIGAINEGQADYHAAIIFPEGGAPLGESQMNSVQGLVECGLLRGIAANKNTTAQQAYNACSGSKGEVHLMGRVYASVWWEVRRHSTSAAREVDQLFTEHLRSLQRSDTFQTALIKIKALDKALFQSKYSADFTEEFSRRGI